MTISNALSWKLRGLDYWPTLPVWKAKVGQVGHIWPQLSRKSSRITSVECVERNGRERGRAHAVSAPRTGHAYSHSVVGLWRASRRDVVSAHDTGGRCVTRECSKGALARAVAGPGGTGASAFWRLAAVAGARFVRHRPWGSICSRLAQNPYGRSSISNYEESKSMLKYLIPTRQCSARGTRKLPGGYGHGTR